VKTHSLGLKKNVLQANESLLLQAMM